MPFTCSKFIGIKFKDGGRSFKGADCWGLAMLVYKEFGIDLPDYKVACQRSDQINAAVEDSRWQWERIEEPEAPCLVVIKLAPRYPHLCTHFGVYVGNGQFIHTIKKHNASMVSLKHPYFGSKIEGFYKYVGR